VTNAYKITAGMFNRLRLEGVIPAGTRGHDVPLFLGLPLIIMPIKYMPGESIVLCDRDETLAFLQNLKDQRVLKAKNYVR